MSARGSPLATECVKPLIGEYETTPDQTFSRQTNGINADFGISAIFGKDRFFAIDNSRITAYDRMSGQRLAEWSGDPELFLHLNSCLVQGEELVCAHSNYPGIPMVSSIEWFDATSLRHLRSYSLGSGIGSLTWIVPHEGYWWAAFANYDGRGGEPGRGHRFTTLVQFDENFVRRQSWAFPDSVLERFAPRSSSGGTWGNDGLLYVTGHDERELYVLLLPAAGGVLRHVATIGMPTAGQAIAWDPWEERAIWSIKRHEKDVVEQAAGNWGVRVSSA